MEFELAQGSKTFVTLSSLPFQLALAYSYLLYSTSNFTSHLLYLRRTFPRHFFTHQPPLIFEVLYLNRFLTNSLEIWYTVFHVLCISALASIWLYFMFLNFQFFMPLLPPNLNQTCCVHDMTCFMP